MDENPNLDFEKFEFGTFPLQYGHQQDSIMIKIENGWQELTKVFQQQKNATVFQGQSKARSVPLGSASMEKGWWFYIARFVFSREYL